MTRWTIFEWLLRRCGVTTVWRFRFAAENEISRRARAAGERYDREHAAFRKERQDV